MDESTEVTISAIVCPRCGGEGVFVSRSGPPCEACNGTGKVTTDTCICRWGYEDMCPLDSGSYVSDDNGKRD